MIDALRAHLSDPTARGLADAVARAVASGSLEPGTRLAPIRSVAESLQLSPTTVSSAWATLRRAGTIRTEGRHGSFIAEPRGGLADNSRYRRAVGSPVRFSLDLSTGVPDPLLLPAVDPALEALGDAPATHHYLDDPVLPELAAEIVRTWPFIPERLTIADGATDAMDSVLRQFAGYGTRVAIENPAFPPFLDLLDAAGLQPIPVELDEQGPRPDALADALAQGAALFVMQPRGQNPTGVTTTTERSAALAAVLDPTDALVVEDDSLDGIATTELVSIGAHLPDRVLHIRSFSKAYGPDLRLAAIGGAARLIAPIERRRQLGQGWSSRLLQRLLLEFLTSARSRRQVADARRTYEIRRQGMVDALAHGGLQVPGDDGINIWVPVLDEVAALQSLAAAGIGAAPGSPFRIGTGHAPRIRVTVGLLADDELDVTTALLAAANAGGLISR